MRKGLNERSESDVGAGRRNSVSFHLQIFLHMYISVTFKWKGDEWTVLIPDSPRAQRFGRVMRKAETSRILSFILPKVADGLQISTEYA